MLRSAIKLLAISILGAFLMLGTPTPGAAAREVPRWQAGLSLTEQRGTYGGTTEIREAATFLHVKRYFTRGSLGITTSYRSVSTDGAETVSGAGDTYVRGVLILAPAAFGTLRLDGAAEIKVPTADTDQGLGSGESDISAGFAVSQFLSRDVFWFADLGYTWLGDTVEVEYRDIVYSALGGGWYLSDGWATTLEYRYTQGSVEGEPEFKEAALGVHWEGPVAVLMAVNAGLSDAAPDFGWTVGGFWRF